MKKLKVYWPFLPFLLLLAAGIVGWFVLPAQVSIRDTVLPKLLALLGPLALGALGGSLAAREKTRWAGAVIIVIALVLEVMIFGWNL